MVIVLLLLFSSIRLSYPSPPDPALIKQALKTFESMQSVYLDLGILPSEIRSRVDNFVRNYVRYVEIEKINGKTFNTGLNSIALLSDLELQEMFGVVPNSSSFQKDDQLPSKVNDLEVLKSKLGEDRYNQAAVVFARLRPHYKKLGVDHNNEKTRLAQFIEGYNEQFYGHIKGSSLDEIAAKAASKKDVVRLLGIKEIEPKMFLNENLSDISPGDEKVPEPDRAGRHEQTAYFDNIGEFLKSGHYHEESIEQCETEIADNTCAVRKDNLGREKFTGKQKNCLEVRMKFRCLENELGIPGEFTDWEERGYVRSLLHYRSATTMPAGWAHTASQIMDMYQQIYAKNVTYYRRDLTDFTHLLNCVYETNGLGRGSPQAAFQYISEKHVVPKFSSTNVPVNCRESTDNCSSNDYKDYIKDMLNDNTGDIFYKYLYLWDKSRKGMDNEFCSNSTVFEPSKTSIPDVSFLPGKAYIQFSDTSNVEIWTESDGGNALTFRGSVYGENIAKPLLYKKGPLAVMMPACYEIFLTKDGVFNYDCALSPLQYLPQWVTIVSYGTTWFGTVLPKVHSVSKTFGVDYPTVLKVSRKDDHTIHWDSFVLPRVTRYKDSLNCKNGGIYYLTEGNDGKCYCPQNKYGPRCQDECEMTCKNGGQVSRGSCECECNGQFYGKHCVKKCTCKNSGKCDAQGRCICHRQISWGTQCENRCKCQKNGYCHNDGSCECIAGSAGPKCSKTCDKKCQYPKVCLYSNALTESGDQIKEFCGCPHGFYGDGCLNRVDCQHNTETREVASALCTKLMGRNRCNTDQAMKECPHACGHCLTLNVATEFDM